MFIDEIIRDGMADMMNLKELVIFKVDNIFSYMMSLPDTSSFNIQQDLFSGALPFPYTWFEYNTPIGFYFGLPDAVKNETANEIDFKTTGKQGIYAFQKDNYTILFFIEKFLQDGQYGISRFHIEMDNKLKPINIAALNHESKEICRWEGNIIGKDYAIGILFYILNFLHCKNVTLIPHLLDKKLIKARQRRNKPYFEKTYTLAIEPMRKILNEEGEAQKKGIQHAFHICRGHFRTYEESKKLFGKYAGTFWIPAHTKGDPTIGKINKDYELKVPKEVRE